MARANYKVRANPTEKDLTKGETSMAKPKVFVFAPAEPTITNMLTLLKKTRERDRYLKTTSGWRDMKLQGTFVGHREEDGYPGITLGIIGLGRIGSRVAKLMRPWGMKMIGYDPYVPD